MAARHGSSHRGQQAVAQDPNLQGARFGRLFPDLKATKYGATDAEEQANLTSLAAAMVSPFDHPKDAADDEESGIPALYTYLGQFIDHDLDFDPSGSFMKLKDPTATVDFRTPAFDMDNIYGRGPGDQPYMYAADGKSFILGDPLTGGTAPAHDLQRNGAGRALIGDPRNDENTIVSQFQGLMHRFHNAMVNKHPTMEFEHVQALVRHHYQYIVVNDFLGRVVNANVLNAYKTAGAFDRNKLKFFKDFAPVGQPYIPMEFAVAAYRFGHSMVRPGYRLNDATLLPIFPIPATDMPGFPEGLTGFRKMITDWGIDWGRFIDIDTRDYGSKDETFPATPANFRRMQLAYRIDTALVDPLGSLPPSVASNPSSLALRNLMRGPQFGLPTGQDVAVRMGATVLRDDQILLGQGVDGATGLPTIDTIAGGVFAGKCPLWTYILAEAMQNRASPDPATATLGANSVSTPQLGPVGGGIVTEVFLGLLFADPGSYLNISPAWTPAEGAAYRLKDFVATALAN